MAPKRSNLEENLLMSKLNEMHQAIEDTREIAIRVELQATKTNGRVTRLEERERELQTRFTRLPCAKHDGEIQQLQGLRVANVEGERKRQWWAEYLAKYGLQAGTLILAIAAFILSLSRSQAVQVAAHAVP